MKLRLGCIVVLMILFLSLGSAIFSTLPLPTSFIGHVLQIRSVTAGGPELITNSTDSLAIDGQPSSEGGCGPNNPNCCDPNDLTCQNPGEGDCGPNNPNCCDPNDPTCQITSR